MAEEAVAEMPLDSVEWYNEQYILDYFAGVGLFLRHDLAVWAEVTLRQLIKLRYDSPDIGSEHHETRLLERYLEQAYRAQHKHVQADHIKEKLHLAGKFEVQYQLPIVANMYICYFINILVHMLNYIKIIG